MRLPIDKTIGDEEMLANASTTDLDELVLGTKLQNGQFQILSVENSNNFGIQYRARLPEGTEVVLKEFFPSSVCVRQGLNVIVKSAGQRDEFIDLRTGFLNTAEQLLALNNPNIAKMHTYFEENGTAYMVMEVIEGLSLEEAVEGRNLKFDPDDIAELLKKLLYALHDIHAAGLMHRDIQPKNITLDEDLNPFIFLDFGTFQDNVGKETRAVSKVLSSSNHFAAMELRSSPESQSPAADMYSLAASMYYAISGKPPAASIQRISQIAQGQPDIYEPLAERFEGYQAGILQTIDLALSVFQDARIRSATEWLRHLNIGEPVSEVKSLYRPTNQKALTMGANVKMMRPFLVLGASGLAILMAIILLQAT